MTTKPDSGADGTQASQAEGSNTTPNQKGSSGEEQYVTVAQFQQLNQSIESLRRAMQSDKDKGIKRVEGRLDGIEGSVKEVLQSYSRSGKSIEDLVGDLQEQEEREFRSQQRELVEMLRTGRLPGGSGGTGQQGVDVSSVLTELELPSDDVRVQAFRSRQFANEAEAYREGAKLQKQILTKQPSDADAPSSEGKRQSAATDQRALMQEYQERSSKLHGQQLLRLKAEMRQKGLEIS